MRQGTIEEKTKKTPAQQQRSRTHVGHFLLIYEGFHLPQHVVICLSNRFVHRQHTFRAGVHANGAARVQRHRNAGVNGGAECLRDKVNK